VKTVIHWFRRDLRVSDNTALHEAWERSETLVPVFIWDDAILRSPDVGPARGAFLLRSLEALARNLESLGHRLIVRRGEPAEQLVLLARQVGASGVFTNRDYEPYAVRRDRKVAEVLYAEGVPFESFKDSVVAEGREVLTGAKQPYTVFTPYSKAWRSRPIPVPIPRIGSAKRPIPTAIESLPLPSDPSDLGHVVSQDLFPAGEHAAQQALKAFLADGVAGYDTGRNIPSLPLGTSRLSPHLRFGTLNIRTILSKLPSVAGGAGVRTWETELIWREFYIQILANFPHVAGGCFRAEYDRLEWPGKDEWFQAWCAGQTGYPIVDAAMRCLNATGWMHNRLRMVVAMFLTKDLLVSWQKGERWFMQRLVDGDFAANNGGWQWSASTGTDAAPYFRIFNPVTQSERFDPEGRFLRQYLPELAGLDDRSLHAPEAARPAGYPLPIVDLAFGRERALAAFKQSPGTDAPPY